MLRMAYALRTKEVMYPNIDISQKLGIFEQNRFEIIGNTEIEITYNGFFKSQTCRIPLSIISPNPVEYKKLNLKALFISVLCFIDVLASMFGYVKGPAEDAGVFIVLGVVFSLFMLFALNSLFKSSVKTTIFHSVENGASLFAMSLSKTRNSEPAEFVNSLVERIKSIRAPDDLPDTQKKFIYHRYLDDLFSESVINEKELRTMRLRLESEHKNAEPIELA